MVPPQPREPPPIRRGAALADPDAKVCFAALATTVGEAPEAAVSVLRTLDLSAEAVILVDANQRIIYSNPTAADLTGSSPEQLLGRRCADGMKFLTCGRTCVLFAEGQVCRRECELVGDSGSRVHVLKNARLIRDGRGEVVAGLEALQDMSELHALRRAVQRGACDEPMFEALARSSGEAFVAVDTTGQITMLSPAAAALLGVGEAQARGRAVLELVRGSDELADRLALVLRGGGDAEAAGVRLRQARATAGVRIRPLTSAGGAVLGAWLSLHADAASDADANALGIVGGSPATRAVLAAVVRLAQRDVPVLLSGETGAGKEVFARALHLAGPRREAPFHAVNCAALTEPLLESELFGHERGAFTGAVAARPGRLELSGDGTLFLDEVGCLPAGVQAKLLRALEQREFERVGGTRTLQLRARIVAATNVDLGAEVRAGRFREDLYFRLRVVPLEIPPLRRRREDIVPLARHFLAQLKLPSAGDPVRLTVAAEAALVGYAWPGNVRELRNAVQFAESLRRGPVIDVLDLPREIQSCRRTSDSGGLERERLQQALVEARFNHSRAAAALGISRTTLWRRLRQYGLAD